MNFLTKFHRKLLTSPKPLSLIRKNLWEIEDDLLDLNIAMEKLLTELEDRSYQNNFQIDHIPETSCETWESCQVELIKIIKSKWDITDDIKIDCCCHMGKFKRNKSKPRTVVCKFLRFKDYHNFLQNVKKLKSTESSFMNIFLMQQCNWKKKLF